MDIKQICEKDIILKSSGVEDISSIFGKVKEDTIWYPVKGSQMKFDIYWSEGRFSFGIH